MSTIRLKPITAKNWQHCIALEVAAHQQDFVPSNLYSIAEAQFYPEARSRAVYNLADKLVGYVLYGRDIFSGGWKIFRIMIDSQYQRRGYGIEIMRTIIEELDQEPDGKKILICYMRDNDAARHLYTKLGFVEESIDEDGKVTARLETN